MVKKIFAILMISTLLVTSLVGCKDNSKKSTSPTNAKTSASPIAKTQGTAKPAATLNSAAGDVTASPVANTTAVTEYSIELDFKMTLDIAGVVFGYVDGTNFCMWQVNSWNYGNDIAQSIPESDKLVYIRPHVWTAGVWAVLVEQDISNAIKWEAAAKKHHLKITVSPANEVNTYIDTVLVYTCTEPMAAYGLFGFRESSATEMASYDNIVITNTATKAVLFQANFDNGVNPFPEGEIIDMDGSPALSLTTLTGENGTCIFGLE